VAGSSWVTALVTSTKLSYTLSPVSFSTWIGDYPLAGTPSRYFPGYSTVGRRSDPSKDWIGLDRVSKNGPMSNSGLLGPLSLPIHPGVGAVSTGDGFGHRWGKKQRVRRRSGPCYLDCWHTSLLYDITYIALLGLTLAGSKVNGLTSLATDFTVCA